MFMKVVIYKGKIKKVPESSGSLLSQNEIEIIRYIKEHKRITTKCAAEILNITDRGARKIFERLILAEFIEARGNGRYRYYQLKN